MEENISSNFLEIGLINEFSDLTPKAKALNRREYLQVIYSVSQKYIKTLNSIEKRPFS